MSRCAPLLLLGLAALVAACSRAEAPAEAVTPPVPAPTAALAPATADVDVLSASGSSVTGRLHLTGANGGVAVQGELRGLQPGSEHGFHFHEIGDCTAPDAASAGDHFNPDNADHGGPGSAPKHLGDLPNVTADSQGVARVQTVVSGASLDDGGTHDLAGRAVVLHEKADDYVSQPAGDAGGRIACGVVR